jgi:hypothetical protein
VISVVYKRELCHYVQKKKDEQCCSSPFCTGYLSCSFSRAVEKRKANLKRTPSAYKTRDVQAIFGKKLKTLQEEEAHEKAVEGEKAKREALFWKCMSDHNWRAKIALEEDPNFEGWDFLPGSYLECKEFSKCSTL